MEPICFDGQANLNLVLWGDPQVWEREPKRLARLQTACETVASAGGRLDVLGVLGDVAEFGTKKQYVSAAAALRVAAQKAAHIFCVTGNHDVRVRNYRKQISAFHAFLSEVPHAHVNPGDRYYFSETVNGYPVICLGADRAAFEASYLSEKQLVWLEARLFEAEKTGVPAFVFNHQALKRTNGLPVTWGGYGTWRGSVGRQSDRLRAILERHGVVFYCTGHLHYGISAYNYERSGKLHMLSAPTVGVENHGPNALPGQGYVLNVYEDRVRIRGADFINGVFLDASLPGGEKTVLF